MVPFLAYCAAFLGLEHFNFLEGWWRQSLGHALSGGVDDAGFSHLIFSVSLYTCRAFFSLPRLCPSHRRFSMFCAYKLNVETRFYANTLMEVLRTCLPA
jgi:hypothetical protein